MTLCLASRWDLKPPRRSLFGKRPTEHRPRPQITFNTKREAEIWAAIYADQSCHPYHRWEVERVSATFSVGVYNADTGTFSHWAEP